MSLSIIVPVYEDREACVSLVPDLLKHGEVVVVDASVEDPVQEQDLPNGVQLIRADRAGRGLQMNLGVEHASGAELLFLHADTVISDEGFASLSQVWGEEEVVGGGFCRRFDSDSWMLRLTARMADWRGRTYGLFFGDQAIFVRRSVFEKVGGFRSLNAFEDYDLCIRVREHGAMRCLSPPILSSARRFRGGPFKRVVEDFLLTMRYFFLKRSPFYEE